MTFQKLFLQLVIACLCSMCTAVNIHQRSAMVISRFDLDPFWKKIEPREISYEDKKWYKQLEEPWINYNLRQCKGYGQPLFKRDLTSKLNHHDLVRYSNAGSNNKGIFILQSDYKVGSGDKVRTYAKQTVIVKFVPRWSAAVAACEVWALYHFGLLVEAGRATTEDTDVGFAIVMVKKPGKPLQETEAWNNAPVDQKRAIVEDLQNRGYDRLYGWVKEKGALHADFDPLNVLVSITTNEETKTIRLEDFEIVDLGHPSIWTLKYLPNEQTFKTWFDARWNFLWAKVINELN